MQPTAHQQRPKGVDQLHPKGHQPDIGSGLQKKQCDWQLTSSTPKELTSCTMAASTKPGATACTREQRGTRSQRAGQSVAGWWGGWGEWLAHTWRLLGAA